MNPVKGKSLVSIVGPTAVGKTSFSIALAKALNTDVISADSRQFFKEMNIGTAKPSQKELDSVPHHFIGTKSIQEEYNVADFEKDVLKLLEEKFQEKDVLIMTGGSGLYLHSIWHGFDKELPGADKALRTELKELYDEEGLDGLRKKLEELDEEALESVDENNAVRLMRAIEIVSLTNKPMAEIQLNKSKERPFNLIKIGLQEDREKLYQRINERVDQMISSGLIEEARSLEEYKHKNALKTVGYQELFRYFDGELSKDEAIEKIKVNSRRYAKRQMTWFKRYDDIKWFENNQLDEVIKTINELSK